MFYQFFLIIIFSSDFIWNMRQIILKVNCCGLLIISKFDWYSIYYLYKDIKVTTPQNLFILFSTRNEKNNMIELTMSLNL